MRSYDAKLVAHAIGAKPKWVDNLLSHHELPGVERSRQGVQRRISADGLLAIEMVRLLITDVGMPAERAARVVRSLLVDATASELHFATESGLHVTVQATTIRRRLHDQMRAAVESVPRPKRGRPRLS